MVIPFNNIVSLGGHCQTAFQIRRHFNIDKAQIFDWWATPTVSLVEVLEKKFQGLFDDIQMVREPDGIKPMCHTYGIMHYHDFDGAKVNDKFKSELIAAQIPKAKSKYEYLRRRFLTLSGRTLFIRHQHGHNINYSPNTFLTDELMERLISALRLLLPNVTPHFLLLNSEYTSDTFPNVRFDHVKDTDPVTWGGDNLEWTKLFRRQKVELVTDRDVFAGAFFG